MTGNNAHLAATAQVNANLPQVLGDFETLVEGLEYAARGETGFNFYSGRGALQQVLPYAELRERAIRTGRRLIRAGLSRGDRVGVLAETGPEFMEVFFGCQYAGLIPCPMPYSMYMGGREAHVQRLAGMMRSARAAAAVARSGMLETVREAAAEAGVSLVLAHEELAELPSAGIDLSPFDRDEVAYIQYSSGSTSEPKGVLISQSAITTNVRCIVRSAIRLRPGDRSFSWLPLYHDMGLVGFCIGPMMGQISNDYMETSGFARRPALWLRLMSENGCTIAYSPSFGYDLAARRVNGGAAELDLSRWRVAGIGGDMVRPEVLERFAAAMAPAGFAPRAFVPSYGMAESTLAVSFADCDDDIEVDTVDRGRLKRSHKAVPAAGNGAAGPGGTRSFVICGRPIPGHEVEVRDCTGRRLGEREIGHIAIRGPSLMAGYYDNPEATAAAIDDEGWLATGDMGYLLDGKVVITGRSKDLILHNGRNIWPQDIEWAVERLDELRAGDAAAFTMENGDGAEEVVVLVQCRLGTARERERLRRLAAAVVHQQAGVECKVVLVPPRSLPFTSSGKLSRAGAKADYLSGRIGELSGAADTREHATRALPAQASA